MKKALSFSVRTSKEFEGKRHFVKNRFTRDANDLRGQDRHFLLENNADRNDNIHERIRPQSVLWNQQEHDMDAENAFLNEDDPQLLSALYLLQLDGKERAQPPTFKTFRPPAAIGKDYTKTKEDIDLRYLYICKSFYLKKVENSEFDWTEEIKKINDEE